MSPPTPREPLEDPNERLLASVIPPPPPTLRARVGLMARLWPSQLKSVIRWSRSPEARNCFLAALAGVGLVLGFYRSEASSAASPADAPERARTSEAVARRLSALPAQASIRSEPHALTAASRDVSAAPVRSVPEPAAEHAATDSAPESRERSPSAAERSASARTSQQRTSGSKGIAKKKVSKKKLDKKKRKARRAAIARASSRGGGGKSRRKTASEPLSAWLDARARTDRSSAAERP